MTGQNASSDECKRTQELKPQAKAWAHDGAVITECEKVTGQQRHGTITAGLEGVKTDPGKCLFNTTQNAATSS